MTKKVTRFIATVLSLVLVLGMSGIGVWAKEDINSEKDLYAQEYKENIEYEGDIYEFLYYYNIRGQQCISVYNTTTGTNDVVLIQANDSVDYLEDVKIVVEDARTLVKNISRASQWKKLKTTTETITGIDTMSAMVFVAGVAGLIGTYMTAAAVFAAMGSTAINYIISKFERATVISTIYKANTNLVTQFEYVWKLTPVGGTTYGPYVYDTPST